MTQLGETVKTPDVFLGDEDHSEKTCPWHQTTKAEKKKMKAMNPDEDTDAMAPNDGGELGQNMKAAREKPPSANSVRVSYQPGTTFYWETGKEGEEEESSVLSYGKTSKLITYKLQYAPHHLIPGNESLKGTEIVRYLGDDDTIEEFAEGNSSYIKDGFSVNYDINAAKNGVWLPSPYALSMSNQWPSKSGISVIKKRKRHKVAAQTEDFRIAYVAAAIEASGDRQFHVRHADYSDMVQQVLDAIAHRMKKMVQGICPLAKQEDQKKANPPYGIVGRLNVLSANLRRLTAGPVWREPLYTDAMTKDYLDDLIQSGEATKTKASGRIKDVL